ncbi:MAG: hypothetical protein M8364_13310 [Methylobacter sp.]|uniref:hypothetical protein n=1 Tax=Methylobacter sp. TaxID=2051955 RepID=UPI0025846FC9|nr:hypothetical protein [Methylobacter sp.]MCL7421874.1 hypothetical protein [Methylobacter sp.]
MIVKIIFHPAFKALILAAALAATSSVHGGGATEGKSVQNPWAFNLTLYGWLPGVDGQFSAGRFNSSVDASFIDIVEELRGFPLAFMGRLEAHYERLGLYVDGNYLDLDFEPRLDRGISKGLSSQIGIMEYGVMYRLFGAPASEQVDHWKGMTRSNKLEVYAGGRTLWMDNQVELSGIGSASASKSLTSPLIGGRFTVEFSPEWFVLVDGNGGGFGLDDVDFAGSVMGMVGYRTILFGVPASLEAGYRALRLDLEKRSIETNVTLSGPFIGLTGYW